MRKRPREDSVLSQRKFFKKTAKGKVIKILRERYLRDDVPCGIEQYPIISQAPSVFAQSAYRRLKESRFALNRPPLPKTVPLAILDPIFGSFMDETDTHIPTATDNALVRDLRTVMSTVYDTERAFAFEFRRILVKHYPDVQLTPTEIGSSKYTSNGHISVGEFIPVLSELKCWSGNGDPEIQGVCYFAASMRQMLARGDYPDRLPCIIVYIVGPIICFAGAVLTDRLQLETLVLPLVMHTNVHEDKVACQAARTFGAFRHAVQKLSRHYHQLAANRPPTRVPTADMERLIFPYQSSFTNSEGNQIEFTYVKRFLDNKLMYTAKADTLDILIKFTKRYSEDAHRFCAEKNVAPKLHAVERLAGGWIMVAMEYLNPKVYQTPFPLPSDPKPLLKKIEQVVQLLHSGGFVHGDVRGPNVMVSADNSQVMLVDFDWAGPEGEARYSPNINTDTIPISVTDGQVIEKRHDVEMLQHLF